MKLVLVANRADHKLNPQAYSQSYYDMFRALIHRFGPETYVFYDNCSHQDIDADVIIFYDIHSSHDITIDGLTKHPALKLTYMNDCHQQEFVGKYADGIPVHKLGPEQRILRSIEREVHYYIINDIFGFHKHLAPYLGGDAMNKVLFFPAVPDECRFDGGDKLVCRRQEVLANGITWAGRLDEYSIGPYDLRKWAYRRMNLCATEHCIKDPSTPQGLQYADYLQQFIGSLALCDWFAVSKYFEIPLAGCVSFMQPNQGVVGLGFEDGVNAIFVDKDNFDTRIAHFLSHVNEYQHIADAGRKHVLKHYTARRFADFIFDFCEKQLGGSHAHRTAVCSRSD